jgi:hypothetical protein
MSEDQIRLFDGQLYLEYEKMFLNLFWCCMYHLACNHDQSCHDVDKHIVNMFDYRNVRNSSTLLHHPR